MCGDGQSEVDEAEFLPGASIEQRSWGVFGGTVVGELKGRWTFFRWLFPCC